MSAQLEMFETEETFAYRFDTFPISVSEYRGDKTDDPRDWTCRDILIKALRDLDAGEVKPQYMIICHASLNEDGNTDTGFYNRSNSPHESAGLLAEVLQMILKDH